MAFTQYSRPNPMLWYEMNYHALLQLVPELKMDITKSATRHLDAKFKNDVNIQEGSL